MIKDLFAGLVALFGGLSLLASPGGALAVLATSIVCTAGAALLIWIAACLALGRLIRSIIPFPRFQSRPAHDRRVRAVHGFAAQATARGWPREAIFEQMLKNSWQPDVIEEAFRVIEGSGADRAPR